MRSLVTIPLLKLKKNLESVLEPNEYFRYRSLSKDMTQVWDVIELCDVIKGWSHIRIDLPSAWSFPVKGVSGVCGSSTTESATVAIRSNSKTLVEGVGALETRVEQDSIAKMFNHLEIVQQKQKQQQRQRRWPKQYLLWIKFERKNIKLSQTLLKSKCEQIRYFSKCLNSFQQFFLGKLDDEDVLEVRWDFHCKPLGRMRIDEEVKALMEVLRYCRTAVWFQSHISVQVAPGLTSIAHGNLVNAGVARMRLLLLLLAVGALSRWRQL